MQKETIIRNLLHDGKNTFVTAGSGYQNVEVILPWEREPKSVLVIDHKEMKVFFDRSSLLRKFSEETFDHISAQIKGYRKEFVNLKSFFQL